MNFTSLQFIGFLAVALLLYNIVPRKARGYVLLGISLWFYGSFGEKALAIILFSALTAYGGALALEKARGKRFGKALLAFVILVEIGLLIGLKYIAIVRETLRMLVPVGISFYTLAITGYVIDVYRGKYSAEHNLFRFLAFVLWFPHILQGPIARYDKLGPQLFEGARTSYQQLTRGSQLMIWGFIKKLVIADRVAIFVNAVYANAALESGTTLLLAGLLYSVQIYMDFSGCVDIALGASELFGIELSQNFRQPYLSVSINDFWRRWHLSLSSWFRDYLYIPLGGNRKGVVRRWINVMIVFAVSGFWHGVGISYVVWGLLQAFYQIIGAGLKPLRKRLYRLFRFNEARRTFRWFQICITFLLVSLAWVFFRLTDVREALQVIRSVFANPTPWTLMDGSLLNYGISASQWFILLAFIALAGLVDALHEHNIRIRTMIGEQHLLVRWGIYLFALMAIVLWGVYGIGYNAQSFIYMNF